MMIRISVVWTSAVLLSSCGVKNVAVPEAQPASPPVEAPAVSSGNPTKVAVEAPADTEAETEKCPRWDPAEAQAIHDELEAEYALSTLWQIKVGGKYGYIDVTGKVVVPPKYVGVSGNFMGWSWVAIDTDKWQLVGPDHTLVGPVVTGYKEGDRDVAPAHIAGSWGLMSRSGEWVIDPCYDRIGYISEGFVSARKDNLWGFVDVKGQVVVQPVYKSARDFNEGLAEVESDGLWGYIDTTGTVVIEPRFKYTGEFSDGVAAVSGDDGHGYIDRTGEWVTQECYGGHFRHGIATIKDGTKFVFVNKKCEKLSTGFGSVIQGMGLPPLGMTGGKMTLVDPCEGGNLTGKTYDQVDWYSTIEGLAFVKEGDLWAMIDSAGKYVIEPFFEGVGPGFSEGLKGMKKNGKWGFIDATGQFVIEPGFEKVKQFEDGRAPVLVNGKWGYIDLEGTLVIQPQFNQASVFGRGLARVEKGKTKGFINTSGKLVWSKKVMG